MARTQLGRELTEAHRVAQAEQAAWWVSAVSQLVELIDPARIDDSMPEFVASALVALGMAAEDARSLALAYVREYRHAEAPELDHPDPVVVEVDLSGAASQLEAVAPLAKKRIGEGAVPREAIDAAFWSIVGGLYRHVLTPGRDVVDLSASVNPHSTGWRRVTDGDPCAFCAMLASRGPAYRTEASALTVTGVHMDGTDYTAVARGMDAAELRSRRVYAGKLKRPLGSRFHDHCSCTVEEVFGEWEPTAGEQEFVDLYNEVHEPGMTPQETVAAMREKGHGVVNDAHVPDGERKPHRRPKTQTGGSGGGKPPPRSHGMLGPDTPDEFPEFNGWRPPVLRSEIEDFDELDAEILLDGDGSGHGGHRHGSGMGKTEFPHGWGKREVVEWVRWVIDQPVDGYPDGDGFTIYASHPEAPGAVWVRRYGRWLIATGHPATYDWWRDHRAH